MELTSHPEVKATRKSGRLKGILPPSTLAAGRQSTDSPPVAIIAKGRRKRVNTDGDTKPLKYQKSSNCKGQGGKNGKVTSVKRKVSPKPSKDSVSSSRKSQSAKRGKSSAGPNQLVDDLKLAQSGTKDSKQHWGLIIDDLRVRLLSLTRYFEDFTNRGKAFIAKSKAQIKKWKAFERERKKLLKQLGDQRRKLKKVDVEMSAQVEMMTSEREEMDKEALHLNQGMDRLEEKALKEKASKASKPLNQPDKKKISDIGHTSAVEMEEPNVLMLLTIRMEKIEQYMKRECHNEDKTSLGLCDGRTK